MFFSYGKSLDIVQIPIVAFKNQRVDRRPLPAYFRMRGQRRTDLRRGDCPHGKCVGQRQRRFETTEFRHLHQTDTFAETVEYTTGGKRLLHERIVVGEHHSHTGMNISFIQRAMSDADIAHVRDRIQLTARQNPDAGEIQSVHGYS